MLTNRHVHRASNRLSIQQTQNRKQFHRLRSRNRRPNNLHTPTSHILNIDYNEATTMNYETIKMLNQKQRGQLLILSVIGLIFSFILILSFATPIQQAMNYAVNNTTNDAALPLIKLGYGFLILMIFVSIVILISPRGG